MLTRIFKWTGITLGGLIVLALVLIGILYTLGSSRLAKHYAVQPETVIIPTDAASIQQGQHWADTLCAHCHGADFSGKALIDDAQVGYVPAPNLTPGEGGAGAEFTDLDWVRALRHGIDPEGRALIGMPSMNYAYLSDKDLGQLIAYFKTLPAVERDLGEPAMSFMGKVLLGAGAFGKDILPAESIDRSAARPEVVEAGANAQYGEYLARLGGCRDCHGQDLTGGKSPEPGAPLAPDITPNGAVKNWSQETFITSVRTIKGGDMPWDELKPLSDAELEAIYLYLQSLPVK